MQERIELTIAPELRGRFLGNPFPVIRQLLGAIRCAVIVAGCGPFGGNAVYQRRSEKERRSRIRDMRAATVQTQRGRDGEGEELRLEKTRTVC